MEQTNDKKVSILIVGYDEIKDYRQFKIAVLKSVNLNFVEKAYYVGQKDFNTEIEKFCKEFKIKCEEIKVLPAKLSNEQSEKLSNIKALVIFNNGEDKGIKRYEAFAKRLPIYTSIWKVREGNLVLK